MTSFLKIYQQRNSIEDKYFKIIENTRKNCETEYKAALTIQAAFHHYLFRKHFAILNRNAILIQKTFRMHCARILFRCLCVEKEQALQAHYFNQMALKIQKAWKKYIANGHIQFQKSDGENRTTVNKVKIRKVIKKRKKKNDQRFAFEHNF